MTGAGANAAPSLRDVQRAIAACVLDGAGAAAPGWVVGDGVAAARRLAVHRDTFDSRVTGALRLAFPAVVHLVGADFFAHAARCYAHAEPPHRAWLDAYGSRFPAFLERFAPAASLAYLADVARLEWAVNRALHAEDRAVLDLVRLARVDETDRERVCLVAHPSVGLLQSRFPVDVIWRAVLERDDDALAAIDLAAAPVSLVVFRGAADVNVARLEASSWRLLAALCAGKPLGAALDAASGIDAAALLARHLAAGVFTGFTIERASRGRPAQTR
jgi:hypothetical protein